MSTSVMGVRVRGSQAEDTLSSDQTSAGGARAPLSALCWRCGGSGAGGGGAVLGERASLSL